MPIRVQCPHCRKSVNVGEQHAGRRFKCPNCQAAVTVPRPAPPPPPSDPFMFQETISPSTGSFDFSSEMAQIHAANVPEEVRSAWNTTASGFTMAWFGSCMQVLGMVVIGVAFLFVSLGMMMATDSAESKVRRGTDADTARNEFRNSALMAGVGGMVILGGAGLLGFVGYVLRLVGCVQWLWVPSSGAKVVAILLLISELALGAGSLLGTLGHTVHVLVALIGNLMVLGAQLLGLILLLVFLAQVGAAVDSKQVTGRIINFVIWLVVGGMFSGGAVFGFLFFMTWLGTTSAIEDKVTMAKASAIGTAMFVIALGLTVVVKYLGLFNIARDEIRKRYGRLRAA